MLKRSLPFLLIAAAGTAAPALKSSGQCRLAVSKETQVSRVRTYYNPDKHHWNGMLNETKIAVDPHDDKILLVASSYWRLDLKKPDLSDDQRERVSVLFRSIDGGKSWKEVEFHNPVDKRSEAQGGDPIVFFNKDGTAYYYEILGNPPQRNRVYKSKDSGASWKFAGDFIPGIDHIPWTGNRSDDPTDLNVYGFGLGSSKIEDRDERGRSKYILSLQMVDSQGRLSERMVTNGEEIASLLKVNNDEAYVHLNSGDDLLVNRRGKLFLPFNSWFNNDPGYKRWLVTSTDHGATNQKPHLVVKADGTELVSGIGTRNPSLAVDNSTGPYANRLYTVFMDAPALSGPWALYLSHSDNDGMTWSDPVIIERQQNIPHQDDKNEDYPLVNVNNRGVVTVSWFHDSPGPDDVDAKGKKVPTIVSRRMATASLDGGATFLPIVPISTKTVSNANHHYMGVDSGADGRMHALWSDNRFGPGTLFHASTQVLCNGKPAKARTAAR